MGLCMPTALAQTARIHDAGGSRARSRRWSTDASTTNTRSPHPRRRSQGRQPILRPPHRNPQRRAVPTRVLLAPHRAAGPAIRWRVFRPRPPSGRGRPPGRVRVNAPGPARTPLAIRGESSRSSRSRTWEGLTKGLPQEHFYPSVLRDAMCVVDGEPAGVFFGTRGGSRRSRRPRRRDAPGMGRRIITSVTTCRP